jgi:recombination protein RecT
MQHLRASLLRAIETQKERISGIIDKRHVLIACEQIEANPVLLNCSPASVFRAIVRAGLYGWVCDGILGQGYLVPFKGEATLIAGYKGLRDLVRRSGQADTAMECVHEGDRFTFRGMFAEPEHIKGPGDRTSRPVLGAYVVVHYFATRSCKTFWWPIETILAHRDRYSIGWKKKGGPNAVDHLWHEKNGAFPVMCMKTVLRSVINRGEAPVSLDDRRMAFTSDEDDSVLDVGSQSLQDVAIGVVEPPLVESHADELADHICTGPPPTGLEPAKPGEVMAAPPESTPSVSEVRAQEYRDAIDALDDPADIARKVTEADADATLSDAHKKAIEEHGKKRASRGSRSNAAPKRGTQKSFAD